MDTLRTLAGWLLFIAMAILAGFLWRESAERGSHIVTLSDTISQMEQQMTQLAANVDSLENQIEESEKTIAGLKAELEKVKEPEAASQQGQASDDAGLTFGDIMDSLMGGADAGKNEANALGSMMKMFQTPQGEKMLDTGVSVAMNMQFADFFNTLAPEHVEAVREILSGFMVHTARLGINFMNAKDGDMDSAVTEITAARETMLSDLRNVIGDEGVALFEQYEQELPARMMDQTIQMQLGMFAGGLSEETRTLVRQTLVEELVAALPENGAALPGPLGARATMENQDEGYSRALERLSGQLTEEEFGVVEQFVNQQQQMVNMFSNMMLPDEEAE
jgi:hypothetical protein